MDKRTRVAIMIILSLSAIIGGIWLLTSLVSIRLRVDTLAHNLKDTTSVMTAEEVQSHLVVFTSK